MTIQHRYLISVDEILAFEYECNKCHSKITILINDQGALPYSCPHCGDDWIIGNPKSIESTGPHATTFKAISTLQESIRFIIGNTKRIGCSFTLEIKREEDGEAT